MLIDSHAHLDDGQFASDLDAVLSRAREAGVSRIVTVGADIASCESAVALANRNPGFVFAAVGIHPHEAGIAAPAALERLEELARGPGVVAIGETGLDYHYGRSIREEQKAAFQSHIRLALKLDLPIVIHCRDAYADCLAILDRYRQSDPPDSRQEGLRGVAHCFSGSVDDAQRLLEIGFMISFAGPLTFPNARNLREVARHVPLDRVLVETDSPYLAPQPVRGRRNEPAFVAHVAAALAELHDISAPEAGDITAANAESLFGLCDADG